jgi:hypothetical protein
MMDRDSITRTGARTSRVGGIFRLMAVHYRVRGPAQYGTTDVGYEVHEGRRQTGRRTGHAGSRLKLTNAPGRSRLTSQPSSRTGENPPYGMIGRIEETSASFEARSAPRSYPTVADDAQSREVRLCHSSWEADEQSGPDRSGAGGAKGGGQGEREPAKHGPDTEPGARVTSAGARTASRKISASPLHTRGGSRMPELGTYGSVRVAPCKCVELCRLRWRPR